MTQDFGFEADTAHNPSQVQAIRTRKEVLLSLFFITFKLCCDPNTSKVICKGIVLFHFNTDTQAHIQSLTYACRHTHRVPLIQTTLDPSLTTAKCVLVCVSVCGLSPHQRQQCAAVPRCTHRESCSALGCLYTHSTSQGCNVTAAEASKSGCLPLARSDECSR